MPLSALYLSLHTAGCPRHKFILKAPCKIQTCHLLWTEICKTFLKITCRSFKPVKSLPFIYFSHFIGINRLSYKYFFIRLRWNNLKMLRNLKTLWGNGLWKSQNSPRFYLIVWDMTCMKVCSWIPCIVETDHFVIF